MCCGCVYKVNGIDVDRMAETHPEIYVGGPTDEMYGPLDAAIEKLGGRLPWTGEFPGTESCRQLGWFSYFIPTQGWVRCTADHPDAFPDLNRLLSEGHWDAARGAWVVRS